MSKNSWLTDNSVAELISNAPKLASLTLDKCNHVTDLSLRALAANASPRVAIDDTRRAVVPIYY